MAQLKDLLVEGKSRFIDKIYASDQFISKVVQGTSPFLIDSSTLVSNLNADLLDGFHAERLLHGAYNKSVVYDILEISRTDTPQEIIIKTKLPFTNGNEMPSIYIRGYAYGNSVPMNVHLVFYIYGGAFCNYSAVSYGAWNPRIFLFTYVEGSTTYVGIGLKKSVYYPRFWIDIADIWTSAGSRYHAGWTYEVNTNTSTTIIPTDNQKEVGYTSLATSITGSAGSVDWANITNKPATATGYGYIGTTAVKATSGAGQDLTGIGTVYIQGTQGTYREGIRIKPYSSWSTIVLGGTDLTADSGTSTKSWGIFNNDGNFYITKNGSSSSSTAMLSNVSNNWNFAKGTLTSSNQFTASARVIFSGLDSGSSDVTDGTEILTSYASNNGFADSNGTGIVYRRQASKLYNYIKSKTDLIYAKYSDILDVSTNPSANLDLNTRMYSTKFTSTSWDYAHATYILNQQAGSSVSSAGTVFSFPGSYPFQIQRDYNSNNYYLRGYYSNTGWQPWVRIALSGESYTKAESDALYLPLAGGWMNWNAQIYFKGLNNSTSVYSKIGYATSASGQTMHCVNTAGHQANGAFYITSNGSTSANDTGGLAIDNEGVTVFGAGDAGSNFTGIFRVLNEDNVADGPQFIVTKASGATTKYSHTAQRFISTVAAGTQPYACTSTTLNTNLNADLLDGYHANNLPYYALGRNLNYVDVSTSWNGVLPINAFAFRHGKPVFDDPDFRTSIAGVGYYGRGQSQGSVTRMTDASAAAADSTYVPSGNSSGYVVKIADTSVTANNIGGFVQAVTSGQNKVWIQVFRAFLPVGATLSPAANSMGTGSKQTWLTSNIGTGKWEWYALLSINGNGGSYSTFGHMSAFLTGGTTSNVWYLSYCNSYELTNGEYDGLRTKFADTATSAGNAATATTASKLGTSNVGAADRPIYLAAGVPTQTTYRMAGTNAAATTALAISSDLDTGIWYVNGTGTSDLYNISDGVAYVNKYSNSWIAEIYQDYRTGQIALRGKYNGTWQAWRKVFDSVNYTSFLDGTYLRKVTVPNNAANDFNTFESMTLTGRGDPASGASLSNAPWTGAGPAGGYGVLTYLWSGYGTQLAFGYNNNKVYIRNKYYYNSGANWSTTWDSLLLTSEFTTSNITGILPISKGGTDASTAAGARANLGTWALVSNSYPTIMPADGTTNNWFKIGTANTSYGILPSQSGGRGSGHNYIGTSSWYWKYAYIDEIYISSMNVNNKLSIDSNGRITPYDSSTSRAAGNYGYYESTLLGHIWSIGTSYRISDNGKSPSTLYGLAYFHTNWSNGSNNDGTKTAKGTYAGGHQVAWFNNGVLASSIGDNIYTKGQLISKKAQGTAPLVVDSSTQVTNLKSNFAQYADILRDPVYYRYVSNDLTSGRRTSADINWADGGLHYYLATSSMTTGKPAGDGHILHMSWDNGSYEGQFVLPTSTQRSLQWRSQNGGTWSDWITVIDSSNYGSYVSAKNHNHDSSYVKLSSTEQTIESTISSYSKGVIEFYRSSGDHICFISFANKVSGAKRTLGAIGFYSGGTGKLQYRDVSANYYNILHAGNTSAASVTLSTTDQTFVTVNGTAYKIKLPATIPWTVSTTDKYVEQSESTTANYRGVVLGYNNNASANTGITTTVTNVVYTTNNLTVQPSTGNIVTKGYVAVGTGGVNSYIASDAANNIYLHNSSGAVLVATGKVVRRSTSLADVSLGDASYPWAGVYAKQFISKIAQGTAPILVDSSTLVSKLNADFLDGLHESAFARKIVAGTTVAMANSGGTITVEANKIIPVTTTGTSAVTFNFTWNSPAACDEAHVIITGSGSSKTITIGNVNSDSTNTKKNNTAIKVTSGGYGEISILYFDSKYFIRAVGN